MQNAITYPDRRFLSRSLGDEARSLHIRARQLGSSGGFALLGALGARVIGVSEARVVQNPPLNDAVAAKVLVPLWCYTISGALHPFRAGAMLPKWCNAPQ